jgi:hypothetical protein
VHPIDTFERTTPVTNPVAPPPVPGGDVPPPPFAGQAYPPPATEGLGDAPKKKSTGRKILGIVLALVVAVVVLLGLAIAKNALLGPSDTTKDAKVGSCLDNKANADEIAVVDCADAKAVDKVVGKVPGVSEATFRADADGTVCAPFPDAKTSLFKGEGAAADNYVLCLQPVKK